MKVITKAPEFHDILANLANQKPVRVDLNTYSLYAGLSSEGRDFHSWGGKWSHPVAKFFDALTRSEASVRIVIGAQERQECFKGVSTARSQMREGGSEH